MASAAPSRMSAIQRHSGVSNSVKVTNGSGKYLSKG